jgi:hypothetical protein
LYYIYGTNNVSFILLSPEGNKLSILNKEWNKVLEEELINIPFDPDNSVANGSSIAFIFKYSNLSFLFLADTHIDVIVKSLKDFEYNSMNPLKGSPNHLLTLN